MKIGSGGLQSLLTQEIVAVKKTEKLQEKKEEQNLLDPGIRKPANRKDELIKAVEEMNKTVDLANRDLKFAMHEKTNRILVKVLDQETGEVIKEYPPEEFLDLVSRLKETLGVFVDKHV